jgi:hypothetical protein
MMSTALNLSPQVLGLGDSLITKLTGFTGDEENFSLCHDFVVSNLLYHSYLEPHEKDVKKKFEGLVDKWNIQCKNEKATRVEQLLEQYNGGSVFEDGVEHEQHGLKARLLVFILSLSNSDQVKNEGSDNGEDDDEGVQFLINDIVQESEAAVAARKARETRAMLAEGENQARHFSSGDSDLSDWSDDGEQIFERNNFGQFVINDQEPKILSSLETVVLNFHRPKKPVTHLPGLAAALEPPQPITELDNCEPEVSEEEAKEWLRDHLMPPYWLEEADSKSMCLLEITNPMPDANYVRDMETAMLASGMPVDEKLMLPEHQVLQECLWILRNPLCNKTPLFRFNSRSQQFEANPVACLSSLMPHTLDSSLSKFRTSLTRLNLLHSFVNDTLDRRKDPGGLDDSEKPPFTYEAYAEALTNVFNLFSADLLATEKKIKDNAETYTLLDFARDTKSWLKIIDSLGTFHRSAIAAHRDKPNWEKSVILIASLNQALSTCYDPRTFTIFVDLLLKTLAPYFRIIGVWLTQGRFEDYRSEFVYGVNEAIVASRRSESLSDLVDHEEFSFGKSSCLCSPTEQFWTEGFIVRPFQERLATLCLNVPHIFKHTLPAVLTCGKSITILTILEKQSILFPGYKSAFTPIQDMIASSELYDSFLSNLKQCLVIHKRPFQLNNERAHKIPMITEGLSLCDLIGDVSEYDQDLVAAYDVIAADLPTLTNQHGSSNEDDVLVDQDRFLVLSEYGLDPMQPMVSLIEVAFGPVVHEHSERACTRLVHLFMHTLSLETNLSYLRRVFLMEAGDLLSEFYSHMFAKMELSQGPDYDASSLNIFLHDCLCRRYPNDDVERFHLDIDPNAKSPLESLVLTYEVQWPLNIVLHRNSLVMYNQVFVFLLRVKHAMWALLKIDANELAKTLHTELDGNITDSFGDVSIGSRIVENRDDKELKLHRIILLKSWLLHFIGNVHDYFMTRVLQSTELELKISLMECNDLDAILGVHNRYIERIYDRCFLHPSASVLKEAVFKVLRSALLLHKYCSIHIKSPNKSGTFIMETSTLKSLEENYAKRHQFLASTLRSMTQKRNVPHLDGLSAALLHSCPSVI